MTESEAFGNYSEGEGKTVLERNEKILVEDSGFVLNFVLIILEMDDGIVRLVVRVVVRLNSDV